MKRVLIVIGGLFVLLIIIGALTPKEPKAPDTARAAAQPTTVPQERPPGLSEEAIAEAEAERAAAAQARAAADAAAAQQKAQAQANAQWEDFTRYGQELAKLLNQSDEINRIHARGAAVVTPATVVQFYQLTDQAARQQGTLKVSAGGVRVPREANDFKLSVQTALREREDAMNKLKDALDKRSISAQAAYADAKRDVDRSTVGVVAQLVKLCTNIGAQFDECTGALGWSGT